jgi:hypothetical protein
VGSGTISSGGSGSGHLHQLIDGGKFSGLEAPMAGADENGEHRTDHLRDHAEKRSTGGCGSRAIRCGRPRRSGFEALREEAIGLNGKLHLEASDLNCPRTSGLSLRILLPATRRGAILRLSRRRSPAWRNRRQQKPCGVESRLVNLSLRLRALFPRKGFQCLLECLEGSDQV